MVARRLLRLYPRRWRERYGDELLAMLEGRGLSVQDVVDIVAGAVDAWLSSEVRGAVTGRVNSIQGETTMSSTVRFCERNQVRYTTRDGVIGAGIMLGGTAMLTFLGLAAERRGLPIDEGVVASVPFLLSMTVSMPFWLIKGQSRTAQSVLVGAPSLLLVLIAYIAS